MIRGSRFEIEHIFRGAIFNHEQVYKVRRICETLGKYMFLDRSLLEERAGEKIELNNIVRCVKYNIIAQLKHEDYDNESGDRYYYQLDVGGYNILERAGITFNEMNILAGQEEKSRILTFNYYIKENHLDVDMKYKQPISHNFYFCNGNKVCYYPDKTKEEYILEKLQRLTSEKDEDGNVTTLSFKDLRDMFHFIPIEGELINVGVKSRTTKKKETGV